MARDYNELVSFMRANQSRPLDLAKIMVSWVWGSVEAYTGPTNVSQVVSKLKGECGWRDALLESLFESIGIQHRRANFFDVPIQRNHSATELFINGKWMFFDATNGVYFTLKGSSTPLSIEEARNNWANVVVQKSTLEGWQGKFIDPKTIKSNSFKAYDDPFFYTPEGFYPSGPVVPAEIFTIYFGPKASYLESGQTKEMLNTGRSWKTSTDKGDAKAWAKQTAVYSSGQLEAHYTLFDDKSHRFIHYDRSNKYDWVQKTTYLAPSSRVEREIIVNDDGTRIYHAYNVTGQGDWKEQTIHYSASRAVDAEIVTYKDGSMLIREHDETGIAGWRSYEDTVSPDGTTLRTVLTQDDGSTIVYDWSTATKISGTAGGEPLVGTSGADAIFGHDGDDVLDGGAGADRLEGGAGNDVYYTDTAGEMIVERPGGGRDTVYASTDYILNREVENLVLLDNAVYGTGNALSNKIVGNSLSNVLIGGLGNDTLEGGGGGDVLVGGAGRDMFIWRNQSDSAPSKIASDLVKDFSAVGGDILNLRYLDADQTRSGNQNFKFMADNPFSGPGQARYGHVGSETWIYLNTDRDSAPEAVIRLSGHLTPLASWFVL